MKQKLWISLITTVFVAVVWVAAEENPYTAPDESWITISGKVASTGTESFELDYGDGIITVEMDDWDWYDESSALLKGDQVTVQGRMDDDLFEVATIEAASVYVKSLNTYFYANPADEEDVPVLVLDTQVTVSGKITSKSGREFTIKTGAQELTVDTINMAYDPLDDVGFQQLDVGDRVRVVGDMDINVFNEKELTADYIVTLQQDAGKSGTD